ATLRVALPILGNAGRVAPVGTPEREVEPVAVTAGGREHRGVPVTRRHTPDPCDEPGEDFFQYRPTWQHIVARLGHPPVPVDQVRAAVGVHTGPFLGGVELFEDRGGHVGVGHLGDEYLVASGDGFPTGALALQHEHCVVRHGTEAVSV